MNPPGAHFPYYTYKQYMIDVHGAPLYRVPIDLGLGCPHRNSDGTGGCTFCPADGSRAGHMLKAGTIEEQVRRGVEFARARYRAERFIAYFQAFTATFAPVEEQRALYERVLKAFPFKAVSLGTRPDCLPGPTLGLLDELQRRVDVWVELGVQTIHDATLARIHRGHDWAASRAAARALHQRGIKVGVHVILGLPGEGPGHFRQTAEAVAQLPIAGIKIHNLHVMRGTALADEFAAAPFPVLDEQDYADALIDFLGRLPPRVAIMRISTDTPAPRLLAPRWKMTKGQFLQHVVTEMRRRGRRQGDTALR